MSLRLGNITKFAAAPSNLPVPDDKSPSENLTAEKRILRYVLQSAARELMPNSRLKVCLRTSRGGPVEVYHSAAHKSAHYGNLMVCGSHWVCLPCAVKIASRRVVEVEQAIRRVQAAGGMVAFVTNTVPHYYAQRLPKLVDTFLKSVRSLKTSRGYKALMREYLALGEIRSLEVTHGLNGWHPHTHSLLFLEEQASLREFDARFKELWAAVVARHGLGKVHKVHGLDVRVVGHAAGEEVIDTAGYVVKVDLDSGFWTPADEVVRGNAKQGRVGGRTPYSLLADYALKDDVAAGKLFKHYASAFKGKNHLRWSPGLREDLSLEAALSDLELAEQQVEGADLLGRLDRYEWSAVLRAGPRARGELLEAARSGDWQQVVSFVSGLEAVDYSGLA